MTPKTEAEMVLQMRDLVKWILQQFENPHLWPMDDKQRAWFLRESFIKAREIQQSQPFLIGEVKNAVKEVKKYHRKKRP